MAKSHLLAEWLSAVEQYETALPQKEAVHQMRVAARRLRAALRLLELRHLHRARQAQLRKAEHALESQLGSWRSRTLPALLEASADDSSPSARTAAKLLRKRLDRLEERLEQARSRLTPKALHRARISVKGVRYLLEVAKDSLPKKAAALESDLKALQASLGELHDVDVRIGLVKRNRTLLRDQKEARAQLSTIIAAQLVQWRKEKVAKRVRKTL